MLFFFFSSRRRHTRFDCDWSSDVCSSDLVPERDRVRRDLASRATERPARPSLTDRKSTRLNSSHSQISYAVFCLKKKNKALPLTRQYASRDSTHSYQLVTCLVLLSRVPLG